MKREACDKCKYLQKRWNMDKYGRFVDGYYGCHYLPHWGKDIANVSTCPKITYGSEESSLRNVCKVNTR